MSDRYETPEAIQRDIQRTRSDLGHKLDELQERLAPGEMVGEAFDYVKSTGAELGSGLVHVVRENPVPVALIGAGIGWLILSSRSSSSSKRGRHMYGRVWSDTGGRYEDAPVYGTYPALPPAPGEPGFDEVDPATGRHGGGGAAGRMAHKAGDIAGSAAHQAGHLADQARGAGEEARRRAQGIGQKARQGYARARGEAERLAGEARWRGARAKEATGEFVDRNPLAVGALGLLAGAIVGALLPPSRQERRTLGRYREEALQAADEMAATAVREGTERMVRAGHEAADRAKEQVAREQVAGQRGSGGGSADSRADIPSGAARPGTAPGGSTAAASGNSGSGNSGSGNSGSGGASTGSAAAGGSTAGAGYRAPVSGQS